MIDNSLEEIMAKYKLSDEEHNRIGKEIQNIFLHDKFPVEHPVAIINIAPPASGKTGLNDYSKQEFIDNNVLIINSDEYKPFHPYADEIAKFYPQYYTKVTDQESNSWTSDLFDLALKEKYNVIFEGTGKNARILDTIKEKMKDYEVKVRGMAVSDINCLLSILERYEYQILTKGWGRLVTQDHFYQTYEGMPVTIDLIEKSGVVDTVEIFKRGNVPISPILLYTSKSNAQKYYSAKETVLAERKIDEIETLESSQTRLLNIMKLMKDRQANDEDKKILLNVMDKIESKKKILEMIEQR